MQKKIALARSIARKRGVELSDQAAAAFASLFERREYGKNELILDAGQVSRHFYVVEEGLIRLFYYKDGRDVTEHFHHEGNMGTCIESLFLNRPTTLLIQALEPSVLYLVSYAEMKKLCQENHELANFYGRFIEFVLIVSQQKADAWRFENAYDRYERFCREYPEAAKRAPISCIASYLLMTSETLSRVRSNTL